MISQSPSNSSKSIKQSNFPLKFMYLPTASHSRRIKRGVNKNKCKTYASPCGQYLNFNRNRVFNHMKNCSVCFLHQNSEQLGPNLRNMPMQMRPTVSKEDRLQLQIDTIKNQMERLKQQFKDNSRNSRMMSIQYADLEADQLAAHIFKRNKVQIEQVLLKKMAMVISDSRKAKINIESNLMLFGEKVVNQIRKLHFEEFAEDCKSKMVQAHKQFMKSSYHIKTKQRYQSAFEFISKFSQIELRTLSEFLKLTPTKKKYVRIYSQKIKRINPFFGIFPDLPKRKSQNIQRLKKTPEITLQRAGQRLLVLLAQGQLQLLNDIWLLLLLGQRFGNLLQVELYKKRREYYKFIKLVENKNKNLSVRYIPLSLSMLCDYTQTKYPVTPIRLRAAVKYCLQQFKCAYGFKHKIISYIVAVFNQQSAFGKFHKSSSTTSRFYIDKNCEFLLNLVFKFPVQLNISQQKRQQLEKRSLMLDLSDKIPKQIKVDEDIKNQIVIEDGVNLQERQSLMNLDGIPSPTLKGDQSIYITVSQNHQLQLSSRTHSHIRSAILSVDGSNIIEEIQSSLSNYQLPFSNQSVLQELSNISNRQVHFYEEGLDSLDHHIFKPKTKSSELEIVIKKNKQSLYKITEIPIQPRQSKIVAMSKLTPKKVDPIKYLCQKCKQGGVFSRLVTERWTVRCKRCDYLYHEERNPRPFQTKLSIEWTGNKQHKFWMLVKTSDKANNIISIVNQKYPHSFRQYHQYTSDFPQNIRAAFPFIGSKLQKQLQNALQNQAYLPLRISKSSIDNGGMGVFASDRLGRNSLICVYKCLFGTSFSIDSQLDSKFMIGWMIDSSGHPVQLLADGLACPGIGRFFNSKIQKDANCRVLVGISRSQIYIFFVTKEKIIDPGEQLFICYGDNYFFEGEMNLKTALVAEPIYDQSEMQQISQ